jgi:hypothetical protein
VRTGAIIGSGTEGVERAWQSQRREETPSQMTDNGDAIPKNWSSGTQVPCVRELFGLSWS